MNSEERIAMYVKLRDHKQAAKKEFDRGMERVNQAMEKLEADMMADMHQLGLKSLPTEAGTAYLKTTATASVKDRDAFLDWVLSNENYELLDVKANKTVVRELFNNGTDVPGVNYAEVETVGVRRGK